MARSMRSSACCCGAMEERPSISWPESFAGDAGRGSLFNWMMRSNSAQAALMGAGFDEAPDPGAHHSDAAVQSGLHVLQRIRRFFETGTAPGDEKAAGFAGGHGDFDHYDQRGRTADAPGAGRGDPAYAAARDDRRADHQWILFEPRAHRAAERGGAGAPADQY